ncbi:MAG TPA: DUF5668 domain-containing protein [Anaerolineaceae bacterium]|nr:DUF5668 domain-containing protein [Anaerolineaceae bacterium]
MRANRLFWGILLALIGVILLLQNVDFLPGNFWTIFWPSLLILVGLWVLLRPRLRQNQAGSLETESLSLPLDSGITEARIKFEHGAGRLQIAAGDNPIELVGGTFVGGVESHVDTTQSIPSVKLSARDNFVAGPVFLGGEGLHWDVRLNRQIPLYIKLSTGAGETRVDLTGLLVKEIKLETGASSTEITLPGRAGQTHVEVEAGAATVKLRVPEGVAARIKAETGLSSVTVDTARFPRQGDVYISPNYDMAANRVDIDIEGGVGSFDIR